MVAVIKRVASRMSQQIELEEVIYCCFISMITQARSGVKCLSSHASIMNLLLIIALSFTDSASLLYMIYHHISNVSQPLDPQAASIVSHVEAADPDPRPDVLKM